MDNKKTDLAINILSENILNLLNNYEDLPEDSKQGEKIQEKLETLAEVKEQVSLGNEELTKKVIDKRNMGILWIKTKYNRTIFLTIMIYNVIFQI